MNLITCRIVLTETLSKKMKSNNFFDKKYRNLTNKGHTYYSKIMF